MGIDPNVLVDRHSDPIFATRTSKRRVDFPKHKGALSCRSSGLRWGTHRNIQIPKKVLFLHTVVVRLRRRHTSAVGGPHQVPLSLDVWVGFSYHGWNGSDEFLQVLVSKPLEMKRLERRFVDFANCLGLNLTLRALVDDFEQSVLHQLPCEISLWVKTLISVEKRFKPRHVQEKVVCYTRKTLSSSFLVAYAVTVLECPYR